MARGNSRLGRHLILPWVAALVGVLTVGFIVAILLP